MNGIVVGLQARMGLVIRLPERSEDIEIQCVVDTGFEGFLTLPLAAIEALGLPYAGRIDANLADDSNVSTAMSRSAPRHNTVAQYTSVETFESSARLASIRPA